MEEFKPDILLVDDNLNNLRSLAGILSKKGYVVRPATSGKKALSTISAKVPELILLDIRMPDMDGYEVCRILKSDEKNRHIPVIFISAMDDLTDKVKGFSMGAVDYITKPFQEEEVLARVGLHLKLHRLQKDLEDKNLRLEKEIAERIRLHEKIIHTEKMLSVGRLASGMAHELNNPLAGMLLNAQVILHRISPDLPKNRNCAKEYGVSMDHVREYLEKRGVARMLGSIIEAGARAAFIVENLVSFCEGEGTGFKFVRLEEIIENTVNLAESDYELKNKYHFRDVEVVREYEHDLPAVLCDPVKLQQAVLNIIRNGARSMMDNILMTVPPKIIIRLKSDAALAYIEIEDNGPGMSEEVKNRCLEPFYTTSKVGQGAGLGLSVAYFIVSEYHGGNMNIESSPGRGAKFIVELPLHESR